MFESVFKSIRDLIDVTERNIDHAMHTARLKPDLYSVAASYLADGERTLLSTVMIARSEEMAISRTKILIANKCAKRRIEFINFAANKVSDDFLKKIKSDC